MNNETAALTTMTLFVVLAAFYFLPTLVAFLRHHHNFGAIAVLNTFLGWTFIGWVVALAMAASATTRPVAPPSIRDRRRYRKL